MRTVFFLASIILGSHIFFKIFKFSLTLSISVYLSRMTGRVRIACNASNKGVKTKGTVLSAIAIDSNPSLTTPPTSTTIFKCQAHNTRSPPYARGRVTLTFIPHLTLLEFLS